MGCGGEFDWDVPPAARPFVPCTHPISSTLHVSMATEGRICDLASTAFAGSGSGRSVVSVEAFWCQIHRLSDSTEISGQRGTFDQ